LAVLKGNTLHSKSSPVQHGQTGTPEYIAWRNMILRCCDPNNDSYHRYGGRGIAVCERWKDFRNFLADMSKRPAGMTLERKRGKEGYSPENCCWATPKDQSRNRESNKEITIDGVTRCVAEWCEVRGLSRSAVYQRLRKGETPEEALELIPRIRIRGRHSQKAKV
jgi:hypothetical protein